MIREARSRNANSRCPKAARVPYQPLGRALFLIQEKAPVYGIRRFCTLG